MIYKLSTAIALGTILCIPAFAFPRYASLAGFRRDELERIIPILHYHPPEMPPGPLTNTEAKLVNDKAHPWKAPRPGDMRGPCPGMNTLANHGYIPRNGIATPSQIMQAVQEAFNMEFGLAIIATYSSHLVNGNLVTNLLSIGGKSNQTGLDPPAPAIVGGLNTHGTFEGDASLTRADDYFFGDSHSFNETLFQQMIQASRKYGAGKFNLTVAAELRYQRIQDSIATNPEFNFTLPRFFTAYAETTFFLNFFIDGRRENGQLDLNDARSFLQHGRFPDGFFRSSIPRGPIGIGEIYAAHPIQTGRNMGQVNNFVPDGAPNVFTNFCLLYDSFVNKVVKDLYPKPTGALRKALNFNLNIFYLPFKDSNCTQHFPYGRD